MSTAVEPVRGAKAILYLGDSLLTILRDDIPTISWPAHWDLPGGGAEPGETGMDAVRREIEEEVGLVFAPGDFVWDRIYRRRDGAGSHFFAAPITNAHLAAIRFGDEGQRWTMMTQDDFCTHADAVPHFQPRVRDFFAAIGA
ncbi:MAG: NUDIX hydrolase [Pseudomonadota bacterium]